VYTNALNTRGMLMTATPIILYAFFEATPKGTNMSNATALQQMYIKNLFFVKWVRWIIGCNIPIYLSNVSAHVVAITKPYGMRAIVERAKFVTQFAVPKISLARVNVSKGSDTDPTARSTIA
jgi:hypothetical protein